MFLNLIQLLIFPRFTYTQEGKRPRISTYITTNIRYAKGDRDVAFSVWHKDVRSAKQKIFVLRSSASHLLLKGGHSRATKILIKNFNWRQLPLKPNLLFAKQLFLSL